MENQLEKFLEEQERYSQATHEFITWFENKLDEKIKNEAPKHDLSKFIEYITNDISDSNLIDFLYDIFWEKSY